MSNYIIQDSLKNIVGLYDDNLQAMMRVMDLIIEQLQMLIKMSNQFPVQDPLKLMTNYKILSMVTNSNIVQKECYFTFNEFSFYDNEKGVISHFNRFNYAFFSKKSRILTMYNQLMQKSGQNTGPSQVPQPTLPLREESSELALFIPQGMIDTEYVNREIIRNGETNQRQVKYDTVTSVDREPVQMPVQTHVPELAQELAEPEKLSPEQIKKRVEELMQKKKAKEQEFKNKKKEVRKQEKVFTDKNFKFGNKKRLLRRDQDKWEEFTRKFVADRKVYFIIKRQIKDGDITEDQIPELFVEKYPFFKQLDEQEVLGKEGDLGAYMEIIPKDQRQKYSFVPKDSAIAHLFDFRIEPNYNENSDPYSDSEYSDDSYDDFEGNDENIIHTSEVDSEADELNEEVTGPVSENVSV